MTDEREWRKGIILSLVFGQMSKAEGSETDVIQLAGFLRLLRFVYPFVSPFFLSFIVMQQKLS